MEAKKPGSPAYTELHANVALVAAGFAVKVHPGGYAIAFVPEQ